MGAHWGESLLGAHIQVHQRHSSARIFTHCWQCLDHVGNQMTLVTKISVKFLSVIPQLWSWCQKGNLRMPIAILSTISNWEPPGSRAKTHCDLKSPKNQVRGIVDSGRGKGLKEARVPP